MAYLPELRDVAEVVRCTESAAAREPALLKDAGRLILTFGKLEFN
jgi:hypothetical protein